MAVLAGSVILSRPGVRTARPGTKISTLGNGSLQVAVTLPTPRPRACSRISSSGAAIAAAVAAGKVANQAFFRRRRRRGVDAGARVTRFAASDTEEPDRLVRYMGGNVSVRAVCATEMAREVCSKHECSPMASIALGRAVMATALLANGRDEGETLQLRILGDGPIGSIIAEASSALQCRGMVGNATVDAPTIPELVGVGEEATLRVTRTHPFWKRPYTGTIQLQNGEIAEDVVQYLATSEQTPASMGLSVEWDDEANQVKHAEGWLVTLLPGWDEGEVGVVETNIRNFGKIEASDLPRPDAICQHLMRELRGEFQTEQKPYFQCKCSKSRLAGAVMMLGKTEVLRILKEKEDVTAKCDWCGESLSLSVDEVREHMKTEVGEEQVVTRGYSPRQLKLVEDELNEMPEQGSADWS